MKVDAYSSLPHYSDHLRPVWEALPPAVRGHWYTPADLHRADRDRLMMVAGYRDAIQVGNRPLVYVEHGAGQSYQGDPRAATDGSYSGGAGLDQVVLFICPSEAVVMRWLVAYPRARAVAVGCPRLDRWHGYAAQQANRPPSTHGAGAPPPDTAQASAGTSGPGVQLAASGPPIGTVATAPGGGAPLPTVAVTFHSDLAVCPETRSAWRHYDAALPALVADPRWRVLGHGHPRLWPTISQRWRRLGVDHTPNADDVLGQAHVLVADNTSLMYEAAAVGIPVVVLNAPWYRRHVHHGLRFWSHPPGIQVDHPAELPDAIAMALLDHPVLQAMRAAAVAAAYAHVDGRASERAAAAILEVLNGRSVRTEGVAPG